jgi:hypothetical protein
MFASLPIDQLVAKSRTMYTNAARNDEIKALMASPYGYTDDDYAHGLTLAKAVEDDGVTVDTEHGEKRASTKTAQQQVKEVRQTWTDHRDLVRTKVKRSDDAHTTLGLNQNVPNARVDILAGARRFYEQLRQNPTLAGGARGISAEIAEAALAQVASAEQAIDDQADETGDARRSTAERRANVEALREHAGEMRTIALKALKSRPDLLDDLGL